MTSRLAGLVPAPVNRQERAVGAQPVRGPERHRGVDAERARLVAGRRDHAPLRRVGAADDHGLPAQLRPIALLHRGEERVQVDVEDGAGRHDAYHGPTLRPPDRRDLLRFRAPIALVAFALAWYSPSAAIVLVLPFLFFVPGWLLVVRCVPRLSPAGAAGVAVVASVFLSAHVTNLIAAVGMAAGIGGLSRPTVLAAAALLAALSWCPRSSICRAWRHHPRSISVAVSASCGVARSPG